MPGTAADWVCRETQSPQFAQASATTAYACQIKTQADAIVI